MSSDESEHLIDRRLAREDKSDDSKNKGEKSEKVESDSESEADEAVDANNTKDEVDPIASEEDGSDAPADIDEDQSEGHDYPDYEKPEGHTRTSDEIHEKRIGTTIAAVETVEEKFILPNNFVPITDMTRSPLDHSTLAALKSKKGNELWLIKLPPNLDPESLDGQTIKFRAGASGQVATLNKDTESPIAVTLAPAAEFSRVVPILPSKSANRMNLGVPIDRQLTLVSAIETPAAPPATASQVPVKQVSDLRLRFLPIGSTKKTNTVSADPMELILAKQKKKTAATPFSSSSSKGDAKRKSTGDAPATSEKTKKLKQDEKKTAPSSLPSTPSVPPPKEKTKTEQNGAKDEKKKEEKKEKTKKVESTPQTPASSEKKAEKLKTPTSEGKKDKKKDDKPHTPTSESKKDKKDKSPSSEGKKDKKEKKSHTPSSDSKKDKEKRKTDDAASTPTKKQKS